MRLDRYIPTSMASTTTFALSSTLFVLALIAAFAFVDQSDACAPTMGMMGNMSGRRKRSVDDDVHVIVTSSEPFDLSKAEENMVTVEKKLKEFADIEGIAFKQLQELPRTAENVGGKFGVHFTVEGAFERCARVLQFIQAACNEIKEVVSGTVKCGAFEPVHVTKKESKDEKKKAEALPEAEKPQVEVKSAVEENDV
ncbi:hypothetical protein PRIPAC_70758 [Pristionchus pacificus]|nr:hypothetical protein PRIPAC_70758 [Pristionchus pacificus]